MNELERVYAARFDERARARKAAIWAEIGHYLQRYIDRDRPVLDIACDTGDFIRNVVASERWASDIRDVAADLPPDVRFIQADGLALDERLPTGYFGTILMSNYLEHLPNRLAVTEQLQVAATLLAPGGRVLVLQPNIRFVGPRYWDFIDHHVPLTERSLEEAGIGAGLATVRLIPRFLPYSTKSRLPQHPLLVRLYLGVPLAWRLLGGQTLYVGERR